MAVHELKCWPQYFSAILDGTKNFDVRKNDRNFQVGDQLILKEWNPGNGQYTGRAAIRNITFMLGSLHWMQPGYVALGLQCYQCQLIEQGLAYGLEQNEQLKQRVAELEGKLKDEQAMCDSLAKQNDQKIARIMELEQGPVTKKKGKR